MATEAIVTPFFRLSFPTVFKPRAAAGSTKETFSIQMIFIDQAPFYPKDAEGQIACPGGMDPAMFEKLKADYAKDPTLCVQLRRLLSQAAKEKWGEDRAKWPGVLRSIDLSTYVSPSGKDGWPIRDGNTVAWDGFAGHFFARAGANADRKPGVVDAMRNHITEPSKVYGGLIARAQINAWAYDNAGNKGVSFGLNHLQIIKDDGTRFGGAAGPVEEAFGAWDDGTMDPNAKPAEGVVSTADF
jgi:hypothetical protein